MKHLIHRIRQKPPHHKRFIALGTSGVVIAAVFMVWFSTQTFFNTPKIIVQQKQTTPVETVAHAIASVWNGVMSVFK